MGEVEIEKRFGPYLRLKGGVKLCAPIVRPDGETDVLVYPLDTLEVARLAEELGQATAMLLREASEEKKKPGRLDPQTIRRIKQAVAEAAPA